VTADPALLGPAMTELENAVTTLSSLLNQMSHSDSVLTPTTEEFEEALPLIATIASVATTVAANTAART
jgi:hypothetical protein